MNIKVEVNGQTILEGDVIQLLLMQSFQGNLQFCPPEGSQVSVVAWVPGHGGATVGENFTMEYNDDET